MSVAVHAWDLLKEVAIIFITSTIVWPQVNNREGIQLHPSTENRIKFYWASVQFSLSVLVESLQHHGLQHARLPVYHQLPEFTQTYVHWVGHAIQPTHPLLFTSPPAFNLSQHQGLFKWFSSSYQVAKVLEFQLQHQPFNEYSGLISLRIDWLDLLAIQGTLKSLLQHHSSKASILPHSAFFTVQLSYPYMTTGKMIALTRWPFVGKVMSMLFYMLSRLVIIFPPRNKHLLIS